MPIWLTRRKPETRLVHPQTSITISQYSINVTTRNQYLRMSTSTDDL